MGAPDRGSRSRPGAVSEKARRKPPEAEHKAVDRHHADASAHSDSEHASMQRVAERKGTLRRSETD